MDGIRIHLDSGIPVAMPHGRLDALTSQGLASSLDGLVKPGGIIVIDLSNCTYLSSAGIRVLLQIHKRMRSVQGEVLIAGASHEVRQVLEIAGLLNVLRVVEESSEALDKLLKMNEKAPESREWVSRGRHYTYQPSGEIRGRAVRWAVPDTGSYGELGMAAGFYLPAEAGTGGQGPEGWFVTTGQAAAFLPLSSQILPDFRVAADPARAGVRVGEAVSFGMEPSGMISLNEPGILTMEDWAVSALALRNQFFPSGPPVLLLLIAARNAGSPSVSVILLSGENSGIFTGNLPDMENRIPLPGGEYSMSGAVFSLEEMPAYDPGLPLGKFLKASLSLENIDSVEAVRPGTIPENPLVWIWIPGSLARAEDTRLQIDIQSGEIPDEASRFMIRRLYTDSARVVIQPLHGGYSAQTFHVTSYDREGRKLRPTVLKLSGRDLIYREADRCTRYALPYIFNNSASVLGAEYQGNKGALRYNFVGIGGEETRLKWLTHYYQTEGTDFLEPLLDKIFLQILKPWYGQPVAATVYPFRDHDPTVTFFPHIYDTVKELFDLSPDDKFIMSGEPARRMLNPFWFLKHEYKRLRDWAIPYLKGICHGDLNMQNILLDEQMNVYLIDFSETRPRSVVSDFARLEAIYLIDNAPVTTDGDLADYLPYMDTFYRAEGLNELPAAIYNGVHTEQVAKNTALTNKMRSYAYKSAMENPDLLSYYFSLLEWVFPVVCYIGMPVNQKRLAMHVSSLLCEKIAERIERESNATLL